MDTRQENCQNEIKDRESLPHWPPYLAGFALGLALLGSFWLLGAGLGASGGIARFAAWIEHALVPQHVASSDYFGSWFGEGAAHVLKYYLVAMAAGTIIGAFLSAVGSRRLKPGVERGPNISNVSRLWLALAGGVLVGFASRLARGCTSGQALTGTAMLFTGSIVFLVCLFVGGYTMAWFVRRQWL
ncbi:YeeE/YedE thiosulfate transporter family protein [Candidatus Sumerlaeota bacterium]